MGEGEECGDGKKEKDGRVKSDVRYSSLEWNKKRGRRASEIVERYPRERLEWGGGKGNCWTGRER